VNFPSPQTPSFPTIPSPPVSGPPSGAVGISHRPAIKPVLATGGAGSGSRPAGFPIPSQTPSETQRRAYLPPFPVPSARLPSGLPGFPQAPSLPSRVPGFPQAPSLPSRVPGFPLPEPSRLRLPPVLPVGAEPPVLSPLPRPGLSGPPNVRRDPLEGWIQRLERALDNLAQRLTPTTPQSGPLSQPKSLATFQFPPLPPGFGFVGPAPAVEHRNYL
jgi:hypothetical protein